MKAWFKIIWRFVFTFEIYNSNYFNWDCSKSWSLQLFHVIWVNWQGFKRQDKKHPHASKVCLYFNIFGLKLSFRIGLQHHTWLHIRNEQIYSLKCKFYNWYNYPPF